MPTAEIRHRIGIDAPVDRVQPAFATIGGLSSWWTTDVRGDAAPGGTLTFTFGSDERSASFEVVEVADDRVAWRGVAGPEEWIGTIVTYELRREDDETILLFTHGGWREATDFTGHCTTKWATFLLGAKAMLEGGRSVAYPEEVVISAWDR